MRTFYLQRDDDETGISGTGIVAQGVEFDDGTVAMKWVTSTASLGYYNNMKELVAIHGHEGRTHPVFPDEGHPEDFDLVRSQNDKINQLKKALDDLGDNRQSWVDGFMELLSDYNELARKHNEPERE